MATDYGPATVKVRLDVEEAKRQIEALRREIKRAPPAAAGGSGGGAESPVRQLVTRKTNPRRGSPKISGAISEDANLGQPLHNEEDGLADILKAKWWLQRTDRMRKFAPIHVQKAQEDASLFNRAKLAVEERVGLSPAQMGTPGGVALTAAAVYATVSSASKILPYVSEAINAAAPDTIPKGVVEALNDFKNIVNNLESRVTMYMKAAAQATEFWADGARIAGKLPDWSYYNGQFYDVGVEEADLEKKFDHFKRMEVSAAVGRTLGDAFRGSFDR